MRKFRQGLILHPFLFAIYPVIFLYSTNIFQMYFRSTFRASLLALAATAVLFLFFRLASRNWYKSGLVTSLTVVLFMSYGHLYSIYSNANIIAAIYAAAYILIGWFILRKLKNPLALNTILNVVSIAILCMPVVQSIYYKVSRLTLPAHQVSELVTMKDSSGSGEKSRPPDIYYIILDEFARADIMKEMIGFDNSQLVKALKAENFYVAENSHANYGVSYQSISSALNFGYVNQPGGNDSPRYLTIQEIQNNHVSEALKKNGYKTVSFATGYSDTDITDSDYYFAPRGYLSELEMLLMRRTLLIFGSDQMYEYQTRALIRNDFDQLKTIPELEPETPKFVFVHIPATHVPFVFGPNGENVHLWSFPASYESFDQVREGYSNAYAAQARFISKQVSETVDAILKKSKTIPIIILQSDHGSQLYYDWSNLEANSCFKERMSIFNAYYFPDGNYQNLYPSISPVNTFRVVFNQYFGADLPLLEDHTYYSTSKAPVTFYDVTSRVNECKPPQ